MISIFEYDNYKKFLSDLIDERKTVQKGFQKKLSEIAKCQPSYFSQVLHSHAHLTNDHVYAIANFLNMKEDATEYFFKLLDFERASSATYRSFLSSSLEQMRKKQNKVSERVQTVKNLDAHSEAIYYTSWLFGALHMLTKNPKKQTLSELSSQLNLDSETVLSALSELEKMKLVQNHQGKWKSSEVNNVHIKDSSPLNISYHLSWRSKSMNQIQERPRENLHYTGVYSFSVEVQAWLKSEILKLIQRSREMALPSKDESTAVFICDFFKI